MDQQRHERQVAGIKQAADFHQLSSYILLFQAEGDADKPLPQNIVSINNVTPTAGIELLVYGLFNLIEIDVQRNKSVSKYGQIMNAFMADVKGSMTKANKKLDSLRKDPASEA